MTDEIGRMIALSIITLTTERHLTDLYNAKLITINEYRKRMNDMRKSLHEQTLILGGILQRCV